MRILLAEHHHKVARALRTLLAEKTEHVVIGEAVDWRGLIAQAEKTDPELVLLDWGLPGRSGNSSLSDLPPQACRPRVIVLSSRSEVKEKALKAGADAFVSKSDSPEKLLDALEALQQ